MTRLRRQNPPGLWLLAALGVGGAASFLITTTTTTITRSTVVPQPKSSRLPWQRSSWDPRSGTATVSPSFSRRNKPCRGTLTARPAAATDWESETDPFRVLGIAATADPKEIKRGYRRLALQFHPDVVTNKDSTAAEKQAAGDRFAKINWAYQSLNGKDRSASTSSRGSSSSSSSSSTDGWTPPHRRNGAYGSSSSSSSSTPPPSTDWRDYMPNYGRDRDEPQYDKGDDSFGQIFSDLFQGAASGVAAGGAGRGGIFKDFVDFLEQNVDGVAGSDASADDLAVLLRTGSRTEIANEMDDTQLLVDQLETKLRKLQDALWGVEAEVKLTNTFRERIELEESQAELTARINVVQGYDRKARKRLIALQTRYKELIVSGGRNSRDSYESPSSSSYTSSSTRRDPDPPRRETSTGGRTSTKSGSSSSGDPDETWKREGFGSFGRQGSGRSRSRRRRPTSEDSTVPPNRRTSTTAGSSSTDTYEARKTEDFGGRGSEQSRRGRPTREDSSVPPHRRTSSTAPPVDDKRRLRELQVDEEFEKLKKDLGL
jgi:hypothetical protein